MAASPSANGSRPALTSEWGGLSPHLIASFFAVKRSASADRISMRWDRVDDVPEVRAPITDANAEATQNWQSPFENIGPDQKLSTLSALVQAGGLTSLLESLQKQFGSSDTLQSARDRTAQYEGRSNLTKLNSTQVFTGMPPLKIAVTAHFRAFKDADKEVRQPLDQLMKWSLPQEIAPDGVAGQAIRGNLEMFPSRIPQIIGMRYADMLFAPIVIESIPYPLSGPRDKNGILTHAAITLQLASLTALDANDWVGARLSRNQTTAR